MLDYLKEGVVDVFKLYGPAYGGLRQAQQVMGMIAAAGKDAPRMEPDACSRQPLAQELMSLPRAARTPDLDEWVR